MLTNPDIHDALVELSKLDGAFVVRGDGFIRAAGVFFTSPAIETELVAGLGDTTRCRCRSHDAYDGDSNRCLSNGWQVRAFSGGKMVHPNRSRCRPWAHQYK